jgi:hypothetical protein
VVVLRPVFIVREVSQNGNVLSRRKVTVSGNFVEMGRMLCNLSQTVPGGGEYEERLRAWVARQLETRGAGAALARYLKRPASWVTKYATAERDADFDTSIKMAKFFEASMASIVGEIPLPEVQPMPKESPLLRAMVRVFKMLDEKQQKALLGVARVYASERQPVPAAVPMHGKPGSTSPIRGASPRRAGQGNKGRGS